MITVVQQFYQARVIDEFVLRGNAGLLKCNLPSFVADFVDIESWIDDDGMEIFRNSTEFGSFTKQNIIMLLLLIFVDFDSYVLNYMHILKWIPNFSKASFVSHCSNLYLHTNTNSTKTVH